MGRAGGLCVARPLNEESGPGPPVHPLLCLLPENKCGSESPQQNVAVPVVIGIFLTLGISIVIIYCCKKKGKLASGQSWRSQASRSLEVDTQG